MNKQFANRPSASGWSGVRTSQQGCSRIEVPEDRFE